MGTGGVIQKPINSVLSAHRLHVYVKFGVCSCYGSEKRCLYMKDRQTYGRKNVRTDKRTDVQTYRRTDGQTDECVLIDFSRRGDQEYIYFIGSHMSPSACCIHSA